MGEFAVEPAESAQMFAPVYVILPFGETPPAEALRLSLAPFQRGGDGDLPREWLTFHDETDHVRELQQADFTFTKVSAGSLRVRGDVDSWHLDLDAIREEMSARGLVEWRVRLRDVEPSLDGFAGRFMSRLERHPVSGGYGRWLNPLGRWDWWDLGGRFNGRILGERSRSGRTASVVSSGPSAGRTMLGSIADSLSDALHADRPVDAIAEADANIELVSRLLEDLEAGLDQAVPQAVVLPPSSFEDRLRWIGTWPELGPEGSPFLIGTVKDPDWRDVLRAVYQKYSDHWAANVAYHF